MKWTDEFLDEFRHLADSLADGVLEKLIKTKGIDASKEFFNKLISNIELPINELPEEIQDFMLETIALPAWLSDEDLSNSNRFFIDHGPKLLLLLYFKSLPLLYSDANGAQVLITTSRLTHIDQSLDIFAKRIAETGQFLLHVMSNDNFRKENTAINTIRKVRLIHAAIRQFASPGWDEEQHGKIINQEDMALTLMTFSVSLIQGLEQLLIRSEQVMVHSYFERWKAIGLLLGVHPDLIPESIHDGKQLLTKILERQSRPSEAGTLLCKALVHFAKNSIPGKIFDITPESLIYYFNGREIAQHLGITHNSGCLGFAVPNILASIFSTIERLESKSDRIEMISNKLSKKLVLAMINYFDSKKLKRFIIPAEFQTAWKID
jgi:hypothetical protein